MVRAIAALMCPPECFHESPACPCHGVSALTVLPLNDIWGRHFHVQLQAPVPESWCEDYAKTTQNLKSCQTSGSNSKEPALPKDPRHWTRADVAQWLQYVTAVHRLPAVHLDRFLMNGKALCLMSIDMFVQRVPLGGKLLYKDFQLRLSSALYA